MDIHKDDMISQAGLSAAAFLAPDELQKLSSFGQQEPKNDAASFAKKFGGGF